MPMTCKRNLLENELRSDLLLGFRPYRDDTQANTRGASRRNKTCQMTHLPESGHNGIDTPPTDCGRPSVWHPAPWLLVAWGWEGEEGTEFYKIQGSSHSAGSFDPDKGQHFLTHLLTPLSISVRDPRQW